MFRLDEGLKVYLHRAPVDFRLSINGLATLVQQALGLDPFAACVYVFSMWRVNLGERRATIWMRTVSRLDDDARHLIVAGRTTQAVDCR